MDPPPPERSNQQKRPSCAQLKDSNRDAATQSSETKTDEKRKRLQRRKELDDAVMEAFHGDLFSLAWACEQNYSLWFSTALRSMGKGKNLRKFNEKDAEDVARWTLLLVLHRFYDRFEPKDAPSKRFYGWSNKIAKNRAIAVLRQRARRRECQLEVDHLDGRTADCDDLRLVDVADAAAFIIAQFPRLKPVEAEILRRHILQGETLAHIAKDLEIPEKTVRSHKRRAIRELRRRLSLDEHGFGESKIA